MKKLIIAGAVLALFSAGITYAATKALVVDSTQIYLKDSNTQQTITSFQDGIIRCYIYSLPQAFGSISCVKL